MEQHRASYATRAWDIIKKGAHNTGVLTQNTAIDARIAEKRARIAILKRSHTDQNITQIEKLEREIQELEGQKKAYMKAMIDIIEQLHHRVLSLELKMQGAQHTY